jgi:hypothetical protein
LPPFLLSLHPFLLLFDAGCSLDEAMKEDDSGDDTDSPEVQVRYPLSSTTAATIIAHAASATT